MPPDDAITVLLVDDDVDFADFVVDALERESGPFTVRTAHTAEDGLSALDGDVDCVVSDYRLPGMDGLEFLRTVREDDADLPFVLFTGQGSEEVASDAIAAGVTDYVRKRPDRNLVAALANRIRNAVRRRRAEVELAHSEQRYRRLLEHSPAPILIFDAERTVRYANEAAAALLGVDAGDLAGRSVDEFVASEERTAADERIDQVIQGRETVEQVERQLVDVDGARHHVVIAMSPVTYEGDVAGQAVVSDITERVAYEESLDALLAVTNTLARARTVAEVHETVIDATREVLGASRAATYRFDDDTGTLERAATAGPDPADVVDAAAWDAFGGEEAVVADDGETLCLPLGNHGVLAVAVNAREGRRLKLAHLLAASAEATLDRVERGERLAESERRLADRNRQLDQLNRLNGVIRRVARAVVTAPTRSAIEAAVPDHLVAADQYVGAWMGRYDAADGTLTPVAAGGTASTDDVAPPALALAREAAATGSVCAVEDVLNDGEWEEERRVALTAGYRAVVAVPVAAGDRTWGALVVYASRPGTSDDERTVLRELGSVAGHGIETAERTETLLTDRRLEVEYRVGAEALFAGVSARLGAAVTLASYLRRDDGSVSLFVTTDAAGDEAADAYRALDAVVEATPVVDAESGVLLQVVVEGETLLDTLEDAGAAVRSLVGREGECDLRVGLPASADVRALTEALKRDFDDVAFVARRELTDATAGTRPVALRVRERLTDRQFEVLQLAYLGGFFEWPRDVTGEELAEAIGIAPPTLQYHLRAAERKVVAELLATPEPDART